ncbi:ferritin-like domain-containing protein [Microcoleus sp. FACHB-1515]|uniref:ferritin-like domain-containing protein n=1 Tax=Cyanophyceae TaxID=3028117 RepID=UPI001681E674|nr:ferritin-like domain-containing protein [Microcoleus sp. FACHB-1515]MBD2088567.1 ferritin-like domain-containing protein [Microcoleus sp. FACHB-1515]
MRNFEVQHPIDRFWLIPQVRRWLAGAVLSLLLFVTTLFVAPPAQAQAVLSPRQVVEYALTLEKLEADFYQRAVQATRRGGLRNAPQIAKNAIAAYGDDEAQHVVDLSAVLRSIGGNPDAVTIPANPNYNAILGRNPFANIRDFLLALQYVEDLGVAAYKGQVQNLQAANADVILAGALEIHTVEARHAAGVRYLRQVLQNADVRPWIRRPNEVIYNENRSRSPIDFGNQAFDGFATADEVLALVGPVLGLAPTQRTNTGGASSSPAAPNPTSVTQDDCPPGTTPEVLSAGFICRPQ